MQRRQFLKQTGALAALSSSHSWAAERTSGHELSADVVVIGGGLGGCAAALGALQHGHSVILTEETDWIGGQLTAQGVPPDEHRWIETHGSTRQYRALRQAIRAYYQRHFPLTDSARGQIHLNPGSGSVSKLCHDPRVALAVLRSWLLPYQASKKLTLLLEHRPTAAEIEGDHVRSVQVQSEQSGRLRVLHAPFIVDATELGDLLPLTNTEYVTGAEGRAETGELHTPEKKDPRNEQAFTMCFAMDYLPGEDHLIDRPASYNFWRGHVPRLTPPWPGKLLDWNYTHPRSGQAKKLGFNPVNDRHDGVVNLWTYRRILAKENFKPGAYQSDLSLVNWPQNDYMLGSLIGVSREEQEKHVKASKELSLSLLYWMQTEAPRMDGGTGFPGLRLRADVLGTEDGLAKYPYVRESRRILAMTRVTEADCGMANRRLVLGKKTGDVSATHYKDSVGIGSYPIDLHPSTAGDNYIDFEALPFEVPLGALLPQRVENLLPACKNIGTTHVTNGCYRLHPVEWGIGEAVGNLLAFCMRNRTTPRAVRESKTMLAAFQSQLMKQGVEISWPA